MSNQITMKEMLKAGVHFGHQCRFWNPQMSPFIFGQRGKIHIINLEKTLPMYQEAMNFIGSLVANRGTVLMVGTKRAAHKIIKEEAIRCNMPYVNHRWLGGMLTNFHTIKQSIKRLKELEQMFEDGTISRFNKKEALNIRRSAEKLELSLGGIKNMPNLPDALFIIDVQHEKIAVKEANKLGIPVIAVVDTNTSPDGVDYIIPGNDDAMSAIQLFTQGVSATILQSKTSILDVADIEEDEFVPLDDEGNPIQETTAKQ